MTMFAKYVCVCLFVSIHLKQIQAELFQGSVYLKNVNQMMVELEMWWFSKGMLQDVPIRKSRLGMTKNQPTIFGHLFF